MVDLMLSGFGLRMFFVWLPLYLRETYNLALAAAGIDDELSAVAAAG